MRTIKYRGKVKRNDPMTNPENGWVEGYYFQDIAQGEMRSYIFQPPCCWEVIPDTAGQFTGLLDKNGKGIYEGDILQEIGSGKTVLVVYEAPQFCYADNSFGYKFLNLPENYTVIGNIHDNPELLKGGKE